MASDNSYRSILKGTSIFGGVQIFQILINWIRGKCVAVLLGTEGMGVSALFTSSSNTLQKFASLGLNLAIVHDMAESSSDDAGLRRVTGVSLVMIAAASLFGAAICLFFARPLSRLTFGTEDMTWQFMLLSLAVGFGIAGTGLFSMLQGLHQVRRLSKSSVVGGLTGLFVGVPLYYFFGTDGIVPGIVALTAVMFTFYLVSLRRVVPLSLPRLSVKEHRPVAVHLLSLGLILMAGDMIGTAMGYVINLVIRTFGTIGDIGLYQAANTATAQYSGMVFAAMSMDYFPRLTKAASDNSVMCGIVNRQTEIVSLIMAPAATLLIITAPVVIMVLFTSQFSPIVPLMRWMGLGIMFRALMLPMAYITFAKGNRKVFFYLEGLLCNMLTLTLSCAGFYLFGLIGLGYALVADNALCIGIYYVVNRRLYGYRLSREAISGMLLTVVITSACFMCSFISDPWVSYPLMGLCFAGASVYGVREVRVRLKSEKSD